MAFLDQPLQDVILGPTRKIGAIPVQVVITENATDNLTITKQPVQQGASITDHSFKEPTTLSMSVYFRNDIFSSPKKIYQSLLDLQGSRVPFDITTPKRLYPSMLISSLAMITDKNTENCLAINISFQQVIIVQVELKQLDKSQMKTPQKSAPVEPKGNKSAFRTLSDGITSALSKAVP